MKETKRRSLIEALTYRALATVATFSVALVLTGNIDASIKIGIANFVIKMALFFINDRVWNSIQLEYVKAKQ